MRVCEQAAQFYNSVTDACEACPASCTTCQESLQAAGTAQCKTCSSAGNYQLVKGVCTVLSTLPTANTCPAGTSYLIRTDSGELVCKKCPNSCTKCEVSDVNSASSLTCTLCKAGFKLVDSRECVLDVTCPDANYRFYDAASDSYKCAACPDGCDACNLDPVAGAPVCNTCNYT